MRTFDLSSREGNVFVLAGIARIWSKQLHGHSRDILAEAKKRDLHDYTDVLDIFDEWFEHIDYEFINDPRDPDFMEYDDD
jgi:6-pyruvoyl-tetrahydropterin synthase